MMISMDFFVILILEFTYRAFRLKQSGPLFLKFRITKVQKIFHSFH